MPELTEQYLSSNILVGFVDGTTWLLTDSATPEKAQTEEIPTQTTFVITACNPHGVNATLQQNHLNTLALEADLKNNNLEHHLGWGSDQTGVHAELSFCVPVYEPEAVDATRHLITELATIYGQEAIFEVAGNSVTLLPVLNKDAKGHVTKNAVKLEEPQSELRQKLGALRWIPEITETENREIQGFIDLAITSASEANTKSKENTIS